MRTLEYEAGAVPSKRRWMIAAPLALVVILALAWTGFWFYAAGATRTVLAAWQEREAALGRVYGCGDQQIGGFPFRFEVRCKPVSAEFRAASPATALAARESVLVAQVWQPTLVIGELTGPLEIAEPGRAPALSLSWSLAQASLRGVPLAPERLSVVLDRPQLAGLGGSVPDLLAQAERAAFHAKIASGSVRQNPVVDIAISLDGALAPRLGPKNALPLDLDVVGVLHGLADLSPRSWRETFRALQAADGRLDVARARLETGDVKGTGAGTLKLTPRGTLDGELQVTVVNVEKLLPMFGVDQAIVQLLPQSTRERLAPGLDKIMPGLGGMLLGAGGQAAGGTRLGTPAELDGQRAVTVPLRFVDGDVLLGPFKVGQVPPLY